MISVVTMADENLETFEMPRKQGGISKDLNVGIMGIIRHRSDELLLCMFEGTVLAFFLFLCCL